MRKLMQPAGVPMVLAASDPLLVVPAIERDGRLDFWNEDNPWRKHGHRGRTRHAPRHPPAAQRATSPTSPPSASLTRAEIHQAVAALATRYNATSAILLVSSDGHGWQVVAQCRRSRTLSESFVLARPLRHEVCDARRDRQHRLGLATVGSRVAEHSDPPGSPTIWYAPGVPIRFRSPYRLPILEGWAQIKNALNDVPEIRRSR
ncbi:MAG: hypothetical protein R3C97_03510 [Geminicoccaceae bacterium]